MDIESKIKEISELGETWKPCPNFEDNYLISSHGRILSISNCNSSKKGLIKQYKKKGRNGYMQVRLYNKGVGRTVEVHTLVAKAFIPNSKNLPMVNHINEDKTYNHVENLEWCTNQYNIRYSHSKAVDVFTKDVEFVETLNTVTDASLKYHIPTSNISRCCLSKNGTAGGYQFRYKGNLFTPKLVTEYQRRKSRKGHSCNESRYIPLREYSIDGTYITTWTNSQKAAKAYGIEGTNIRKCGRGEINTTGGRIFLRDTERIEDRLKKLKK